MKTFKQFLSEEQQLTESFKNLFINDTDAREEYIDQVWDILQRSYKAIGGIKGSGFNAKQDLIDNIPMWKINVKNGKVIAVVMYKDKGGRKLVATGTDGSAEGVKAITSATSAETKRSFGEKSKKALGSAIKELGDDAETFMIEPSLAGKTLKKDVTSVSDFIKSGNQLSADDKFTYDKYPQYRKFMYIRKIKGEDHLKIMFGTPGLKII